MESDPLTVSQRLRPLHWTLLLRLTHKSFEADANLPQFQPGAPGPEPGLVSRTYGTRLMSVARLASLICS